jgi:hypothetical protein
VAGELGRTSYELDVDLGPLRRGMAEGRKDVDQMETALDALSAVAELCEHALHQVKMSRAQAAETTVTAATILQGVRGISDEARDAARELDNVRITGRQAAESNLAGDTIKRNLRGITGDANEARRAVESVRLLGGVPGRSGVGVGVIGSGYGRIGLLGTAIGAGVLTTPAAGPAAAGFLAATPVLAGAAAGSLGVLALAFDNVGKAIGGDKKAFDSLVPSAQKFVSEVRSLDGFLDQLKERAAGGLFPGLEKGLQDALSPGTIHVVEQAIDGLARALGNAGEQWGQYFGSPEFQQLFGPLMREGARDVELLSHTALNLADAVGVLARAGIPLTEWMLKGLDAATRLADEWLRDKDATGQLGGAMDEAQSSIRLVGNLLGSLVHLVAALGDALYPVAKVAVKDLTDGLNWLANEIHDNRDAIRDFVGGALTALVNTLKFVVPILETVLHDLNAIAHAVGGWDTAFEIILGGLLAKKMLGVAGGIADLATKVGKVGLAADGAAGEVGILRAALIGLGGPEVLAAIAAVAGALWLMNRSAGGVGSTPVTDDMGNAGTTITRGKNGQYYAHLGGRYYPISAAQAQANIDRFSGGAPRGDGLGPEGMRGATAQVPPKASKYSQAQLAAMWIQAGGDPAVAQTMAAIAMAESSGRSNATNYNTNGTTDRGLWQINSVHGYVPSTSFDPLANARQAVAVYNSQGLKAWSTYNNGSYLKFTGGNQSPFGPQPAFTSNLGPKPTMPTGDALLSDALRDAIANAKNKATTAGGPSIAAHWLNVELDDLKKARTELEHDLDSATGKRKTAIKNELRSIDGRIADVNKQITTNLKQQAQAIKQSFSSQISTAKSNISSAMSTLKQTLDAQLQQHLQDYIDTVLGPRFYQGTDAHGMPLQTPLEKKLADMQAADTLKQYQDAITAADTPEARAAAQRALDEYQLSIDASKERAQVDHDYAEAVKKAQADEAEQQRKLNLALDTFGKGLADGTTKVGGLQNILDGFGLSLTADDGVIGDFQTLGDAVRALALVLAKEAQKLNGVGDTKDASNIQNIIDKIGNPLSSGGLGGAAGYFMLNPIKKMAAGGIGTVTQPTLFLAGEAGTEQYAFSGGGRSLASALQGTSIGGDGAQYAELRSFANEIDLAIWLGKQMQKANKRGIKFELV